MEAERYDVCVYMCVEDKGHKLSARIKARYNTERVRRCKWQPYD